MPRPNDVGVGTAVIVLNDDKILLLRRKGAHAAGLWSVPGGWIDSTDDNIAEAAAREVFEETGIRIHLIAEHGHTTEFHDDLGVRTITLYFASTEWEGTPSIKEPEKCDGLGWFTQDNLPKGLFPGLEEKINQLIPDTGASYGAKRHIV